MAQLGTLTDRRHRLRSDQRRDEILASLDRCLQETGFESTNITDIARHAGVTRSAFYFYFENKAAAVAALAERVYHEAFLATETLTRSDAAPRARITAMIASLFDTWERHCYLHRAMLEARGASTAVRALWDSDRASFVGPVAAWIDAERAARRAPDGPPAAVLASLLLELNDRLLERLTIGGELTRDQVADGAVTIWLRTIYGTDQE